MRTVLIDPPPRKHVEKHDTRTYPHLGLAYIAAYLKSKGLNYIVIDGKFGRLALAILKKYFFNSRAS